MEKKEKLIEWKDIIFIVCCLVIFYVVPILFYVDSYKKGYDITDTGLAVYLAIIPLSISIVSIIYVLLTKQLIKCICIASLCTIPTAFFMPMMSGLGSMGFFAAAIAVIALIGGSIGYLIRWVTEKLIGKFQETKRLKQEN